MRSKYDSLIGRRGKKRALIAVGHKILLSSYYILKDKENYKELGSEYLNSRRKDKKITYFVKQLQDLGMSVSLSAG